MSPGERRALILLLALAVAGHAVRLVASRAGAAPGGIELVRVLPGQSPLAHKDSIMAWARPLEPGERVNLDRADPAQIARLPRVGPALAKRIVADRQAHGPFGSLEGLDRVPGVGSGLLSVIREQVSFESGTGPVAGPQQRGVPTAPLSLNSASAAELEALPGIGVRRAEAILRDRERNGPFPSVDALTRVPGIKPALVRRVRERLQVP